METQVGSVSGSGESAPRKWRALEPLERRVLGVLVEKAKTVPDSYPMTLNGIVSGCNQKSNREPKMDVDENQVENAIESLRRDGAMVEIHGGGRVPKFKHFAYEWLGVDKVELAVMTELLLRGEQTLGDLRARASRMEAIPDLGTLQTIVRRLVDRGLMQELTPPGRGQLVSHNLYPEGERNRLLARARSGELGGSDSEATSSMPSSSSSSPGLVQELVETVRQLEARVAELERRLGIGEGGASG